MNEFEELVKNLNLTEEEINLFNEKNIIPDRVKHLIGEFLKDETFEKSGAPASNRDGAAMTLRVAGVVSIIQRHNRRMRELGRESSVISMQWLTVAAIFSIPGNGGNYVATGIMLTITLYLENNPDIPSSQLLMNILTAGGIVYIGQELTTWLANHFMSNEYAVMLGTMLSLALTARYSMQLADGTFGRTPFFPDEHESATINGVEASPRTAGVVGHMLRQRTRELENTDEQPTPRREPVRRRLPMTNRERGRRRRRASSARRTRRSSSDASELDKNNIKF